MSNDHITILVALGVGFGVGTLLTLMIWGISSFLKIYREVREYKRLKDQYYRAQNSEGEQDE